MMTTHRTSRRRRARRALLTFLVALAAHFVLADEVHAQTAPGAVTGPPQQQQGLPANGLLRYSDAVDLYGFTEIGPGVSALIFSETYSSDLTIQLVVDAPLSGHPTKFEVLLLQVPFDYLSQPASERHLVIAFHPFAQSPVSPFNGSRLPEECSRRGWMLLAPNGLSQTNFGNLASQEALDAILALIHPVLPFSPERVYTAGFSMGATGALSYAMRHQDPQGLRIAGVICHTGTIDVVDDYETGTAQLKQVLSQEFGGSPPAFAYERINPGRLSSPTTYFADRVAVWNLIDVPIYFHLNLTDPNQDLVQHNLALHDFLATRGFDVTLDVIDACQSLPANCEEFAPGVCQLHRWCTLRVAQAFDFLEGSTAPGPVPTTASVIEIYADRQDRYRFTEVVSLDPETVGRFRVLFPTGGANLLGVHGIRGIGELALDFPSIGLVAGQPMSLTTWSSDGKATTLELREFPLAPSQVLVNGGAALSWSYDAEARTLRIQPTANGAFALVEILP